MQNRFREIFKKPVLVSVTLNSHIELKDYDAEQLKKEWG
jgi:hypothetical protein